MAELDTVETPEIDVDAMSDEEFASFKSGMMEGEQPTPDEPEPQTEDNAVAEPQGEAQTAEDDDDDDDTDQSQRSETVSFDRFHRTNERRKAAEKERDEARERAIRIEERLQALLDVQQQAQPKPEQQKKPEDDIPDDNDPVAIVNWAKKELLARKQREEEEAKQREAQTREQQEWERVYNDVNSRYTATAQSDPTIVEAHNALRKSLGEELTEVYGYSQQQALQELQRIENQHIAVVAQNGWDIGDYIKKLARTRGWAPKPAEPTPDPQKEMNEVAKREEARQASISLGKTGGAAAEIGKITPQQLADMSDEEFAAYKDKYGSVVHAFQ